MAKHFNSLSAAEAERLALLAEEMGEAIQAIGKILRHGYESHNPTIRRGPTNRRVLTKEMGDVMAALTLLTDAEDILMAEVVQQRQKKRATVKRWLHHQPKATP